MEQISREGGVETFPRVAPILILTWDDLKLVSDCIEAEWPTKDDGAVTWHDGPDWFVSMDIENLVSDPEITLEDILGIIAHESFHVAQGYLLQNIGEEEPASEEVAYLVQSVSWALFHQLFSYLGCQ